MKTLDLIRYLCQNADKIDLIEMYDRIGDMHIHTKVTETIHFLASIDPSWYDEFLWHTEIRGRHLFISPIIEPKLRPLNYG